MIIRCTKDLRTLINPTIAEGTDDSHLLFSWHAKKMRMHGKNTILLVNDSNRYVLVLYGLLAKDIRKLHEYLPTTIEEVFGAEAISPDVIDEYLKQAGTVVYGTTGNRRQISRLNRAGLELEHYIEDLREGEVVQTEISLKLSDSLVETGDGDYFSPNEEMRKDLMEVLGFDSIGFPALQLRVATQSSGDEQWRQIVVPEQLLKRHLGPIINSAFGRKSFQPYELLWNESEKRGVPVVSTIEETPTYGFAQPPINPASLSERRAYHIVTEKTIYDEFYNCPKCLDGEGGFPSEEKPVKSNQIRALELASINMKLERFRS